MYKKHDLVQRDEITRLSLVLRNAYYNFNIKIANDFNIPFGGALTESIGAWPEFILRGTFCKRSNKGFCSPCFYSRFPISQQSRTTYLDMLSKQISHITNNFEQLVSIKQYGQASGKSSAVSLVLTPTGSFFDDYEFPIDIRLNMERELVKIAEQQDLDVCLHIESHCDDFNQYNLSDVKSEEEITLLKKLNCRVIFGFESVNEYARNVLYNKHLELSDFEKAVDKLKAVGLTPGAFVFAGLFAYNDLQTRNDVLNTISYLLETNVFPVLMFQNAQPYTITDVLIKNETITLIEPITVAWIITDVLELLRHKESSYWLIADPIGGPPEPDCHIFRKPQYTCQTCTKAIYEALVELRISRCFDSFLVTYEKIKQCDCYAKYIDYIKSLSGDTATVHQTADSLLSICNNEIQTYLKFSGGIK